MRSAFRDLNLGLGLGFRVLGLGDWEVREVESSEFLADLLPSQEPQALPLAPQNRPF